MTRFELQKKLDEEASRLTGINVIKDQEYQAVTYSRVLGHQGFRTVQARSKTFKSSKRRI